MGSKLLQGVEGKGSKSWGQVARAANATLDFHNLASAAQEVYREQAQKAHEAVGEAMADLSSPRPTWRCRPDPSKVPSRSRARGNSCDEPTLHPAQLLSLSSRAPARVRGERKESQDERGSLTF